MFEGPNFPGAAEAASYPLAEAENPFLAPPPDVEAIQRDLADQIGAECLSYEDVTGLPEEEAPPAQPPAEAPTPQPGNAGRGEPPIENLPTNFSDDDPQREGHDREAPKPGIEQGEPLAERSPKESEFRVKGELEKAHPEIPPLPPTPITPDARAYLESLGLEESHIEQLRTTMSSLRYDLCPEKVKRIVQNGGYVGEAPDGSEQIVLPDFHNYTDRLDGTCYPLALQCQQLLHSSGYLETVNQDLASKGKPPLQSVYLNGLARTHFNREGANHTWPGLAPEGSNKLDDILAIDPSFQEISTHQENGYQPERAVILSHPEGSTFADLEPAVAVPVGEFVEDDEGPQLLLPDSPEVLGVSSDRDLVYLLAFFRDDSDEKICPVIGARPANSDEEIYCRSRSDGSIEFLQGEVLTVEQKAEMERMVADLQALPLIEDKERAQEIRDVRTEVLIPY